MQRHDINTTYRYRLAVVTSSVEGTESTTLLYLDYFARNMFANATAVEIRSKKLSSSHITVLEKC